MNNTTRTETIAAAEAAGRAAFHADRPAAPALDATIRALLAGIPVGSGLGMDIMRAFSSGFRAEVEAEVAELLTTVA